MYSGRREGEEDSHVYPRLVAFGSLSAVSFHPLLPYPLDCVASRLSMGLL